MNENHVYYDSTDIEIIHADCRSILPTWREQTFDMVLTDPPYGYNYTGYKGRHAATPLANDSPGDFGMVCGSFAEAARLLVPGAAAAYFCSGSKATVVAQWVLTMAEELNFESCVVWRKPGLGLGARYRGCYETILVAAAPGAPIRWYGGRAQGNVIDCRKVMPKKDGGHPTPKPVELVERLILNHTQPGDIILDPFMGEGTTLVAAKRLGRRAVGIEVEERWCERAVKRLESEEAFPIGDPELPYDPPEEV